ncbi:MAG: hypothetical protein VYC39_20230 [Myxococcota bacterium]|nr:hypothetical protein [Myxococcota bacterium]
MSKTKKLNNREKIRVDDVSMYIDSDGMVTDQHGYHVCHVDLVSKIIWVNVTITDPAFDEENEDAEQHLTQCFDDNYRCDWMERGFTEEYADWCEFRYKDGTSFKAWQFTLSVECHEESVFKDTIAWVFNQELNISL